MNIGHLRAGDLNRTLAPQAQALASAPAVQGLSGLRLDTHASSVPQRDTDIAMRLLGRREQDADSPAGQATPLSLA